MLHALTLMMLLTGCMISGVMVLANAVAMPRQSRGGRNYQNLHGLKGTAHHDFTRGAYHQYDDARQHRYERRDDAKERQRHDEFDPLAAAAKTPDWCIVLGIEKTASPKDMRSAYVRIMRTLHPDVAPQNALTSKRCAVAAEAYDEARRYAKAHGRS